MHKEQPGAPGDAPSKTAAATQDTAGYPLGRGYGHDYMRGGEVFGGYGYSDRPEYEQTRGESAQRTGS